MKDSDVFRVYLRVAEEVDNEVVQLVCEQAIKVIESLEQRVADLEKSRDGWKDVACST